MTPPENGSVSVLTHILALREADMRGVASALVGTERAISAASASVERALGKADALADARYAEVGALRAVMQELAKALVAVNGKIDNTDSQNVAKRAAMTFAFQVISSLASGAAIIGVLLLLIRGH
jgi:hypothetical protein